MRMIVRNDTDRPVPKALGTAATGIVLFSIALAAMLMRPADALAQRGWGAARPVSEVSAASGQRSGADRTLRFKDHDLHPDLMYRPYLSGSLLGDNSSSVGKRIEAFRELLALYIQRQGVDDNFTLRVIDKRNGKILEVYSMEAERNRFEREGRADWAENDRKRRLVTRELIEKYNARGVPEGMVSVRWGRKDEVWEARAAELPTIEYEMRLARMLGLSLMATEIGTVETFNRDRVVSSAGARSRYQMMPSVLRQNDIHRYTLRTGSGASINVVEEWHPLLTMPAAFATLKGYINSVGHEIPGISAYHAGPGNIFKIYERFLELRSGGAGPSSTVVDAYIWALTDGFETVSSGSSFGSYSRGYVPSIYGSLKAVEEATIDTTLTQPAERVQLRPGKTLALSRILQALGRHDRRLQWGTLDEQDGLYERFRALNPHIALPVGKGDAAPVRGDVRFVSSVKGAPVRFFLPLGGSEALADDGLDVLDADETFRFDADAFRPAPGDITRWDREYDGLVEEIGRFGFTSRARSRLAELRARFQTLLQENPTPYRKMQYEIIKTHDRIWQSAPWESLARARTAHAAKLRDR